MTESEKSKIKTKNIVISAYLDVCKEIDTKYKSQNDRKFALRCLSVCHDWAMSVGVEKLKVTTDKDLKNDCKKFVKKNLKNDNFGSILISIFLSVILKLIIEWIINKFLEKLKTRIEHS